MKKIFLLLVILALLFTTAQSQNDKEEVEAAFTAWFEAYKNWDLEKILALSEPKSRDKLQRLVEDYEIANISDHDRELLKSMTMTIIQDRTRIDGDKAHITFIPFKPWGYASERHDVGVRIVKLNGQWLFNSVHLMTLIETDAGKAEATYGHPDYQPRIIEDLNHWITYIKNLNLDSAQAHSIFDMSRRIDIYKRDLANAPLPDSVRLLFSQIIFEPDFEEAQYDENRIFLPIMIKYPSIMNLRSKKDMVYLYLSDDHWLVGDFSRGFPLPEFKNGQFFDYLMNPRELEPEVEKAEVKKVKP